MKTVCSREQERALRGAVRRGNWALKLALCVAAGLAAAPSRPARADLDFGEAYVWPRVGAGSRDAANVRAVQYLLRAQGYKVSVDGHFGQQTRACLKQFQQQQKGAGRDVAVDGELGPHDAEWEFLVTRLSQGDKSLIVRAAQNLLRARGYHVALDGVYGDQTESAVEKFQMDHDRNGIGGIGYNDWCELLGGHVHYE